MPTLPWHPGSQGLMPVHISWKKLHYVVVLAVVEGILRREEFAPFGSLSSNEILVHGAPKMESGSKRDLTCLDKAALGWGYPSNCTAPADEWCMQLGTRRMCQSSSLCEWEHSRCEPRIRTPMPSPKNPKSVALAQTHIPASIFCASLKTAGESTCLDAVRLCHADLQDAWGNKHCIPKTLRANTLLKEEEAAAHCEILDFDECTKSKHCIFTTEVVADLGETSAHPGCFPITKSRFLNVYKELERLQAESWALQNLTAVARGTADKAIECELLGVPKRMLKSHSSKEENTEEFQKGTSDEEKRWFRCKGQKGFCIHYRDRCNGVANCGDGSDEVNCTLKEWLWTQGARMNLGSTQNTDDSNFNTTRAQCDTCKGGCMIDFECHTKEPSTGREATKDICNKYEGLWCPEHPPPPKVKEDTEFEKWYGGAEKNLNGIGIVTKSQKQQEKEQQKQLQKLKHKQQEQQQEIGDEAVEDLPDTTDKTTEQQQEIGDEAVEDLPDTIDKTAEEAPKAA